MIWPTVFEGSDTEYLVSSDADGLVTLKTLGSRLNFKIDTINFKLPTTDGDLNDLLTTDGAGDLSWVARSAIGVTDHGGLTGLLDDDHTQYRLESADHTHQSTGLQAGQLDHGLALTGLGDDDHTQYGLKSGTLAQFAATTSAQLFGVISDETGGSGVLVGSVNPTLNGITMTAGSDIRPTADSTTAINIAQADGTDFVTFDTTNKRVGILTAAPAVALDLAASLNSGLKMRLMNTNTGGSANAAIQVANDVSSTGELVMYGSGLTGSHFGLARANGCFFIISSAPFGIGTETAHDYTIGTNNLERLRVLSTGEFGVGTNLPTGQIHVDQSSTTAAIPVLILDQADVDQPLIEFVTTIGTGNALEAVGAKVLTPTHFAMVKLPGGLTRYFEVGTIA